MNTQTAKRNALNATTKKEQKIAAQIAELDQDSDEAQELLSNVTNPWIIELSEILQNEQQEGK